HASPITDHRSPITDHRSRQRPLPDMSPSIQARQLERWSPWVLLLAVLVIWQILCSALQVSEYIFPSPARIFDQLVEFRSEILRHAWRTLWVTLMGFALAILVGVLLGFLIGSSRLAYAAIYPLMTA